MAITVGELARLTGLTVRTLHYYDEIGLCSPSQRTAAGYRLYTDTEVLRLQEILVYRELGVPLDAIGAALAAEGDRAALLHRHRAALIAQRERIDRMLGALDVAIATHRTGESMQPEDFKQLFDGFDPSAYDAEAEARWGSTDAYQESARRTKQYGPPEWTQIKAEATAITTRMVALMTAGADPTSAPVQAVLADHRAHISKWFYPLAIALQQQLGQLYVTDPRFTANLERAAPGLAAYWYAATQALATE